jgi:hypothetical protein
MAEQTGITRELFDWSVNDFAKREQKEGITDTTEIESITGRKCANNLLEQIEEDLQIEIPAAAFTVLSATDSKKTIGDLWVVVKEL